MSEQPEPELLIACRTSASDCFPDLEYAVLMVDRPYLTKLIKRMGFAELCKKYDESFYRCSFFECGPDYYRDLNLEQITDEAAYQEIQETLDECGWALLPTDWVAPENPPNCRIGDEVVGRTECDMIAINECSVMYTAHPKNADGPEDIECQSLHTDFITYLLGELAMKVVPPGKEERLIQL